MPYMTLHRNFTLPSLCGRILDFAKNKPTWVPPEAVKEALAIGAEQIDDGDVKETVLGAEEGPALIMTPEERTAKLYAAYDLMNSRETRGDFTGQGVPNTKVLAGLCGFEILGKERDESYQEYKDAKEVKAVAAAEAVKEAAEANEALGA